MEAGDFEQSQGNRMICAAFGCLAELGCSRGWGLSNTGTKMDRQLSIGRRGYTIGIRACGLRLRLLMMHALGFGFEA